MIEEANDYYFPAWTALYLKFTRVLILLLTVFMTPVFVLADAESAVDSAGTLVYFGAGCREYPACVSAAHPGAGDRRPASGGSEYSEYAEYAA